MNTAPDLVFIPPPLPSPPTNAYSNPTGVGALAALAYTESNVGESRRCTCLVLQSRTDKVNNLYILDKSQCFSQIFSDSCSN